MSTDFIALFDVSVERLSPEWLLPRVEARSDVFAGIVTKYGHAFRMQRWAVEAAGMSGRGPVLAGPGGFVIECQDHTIELWHGIRFSMFTGDVWHRDALRRVCFLIAEMVGSARAIYTHECMPYGGHDSLTQIEAALYTRIGPPANTFEDLHAAEYFGPHAWYIDTFSDLRRSNSGECLRRTNASTGDGPVGHPGDA